MVDSSERYPSDASVARALGLRTGETTDAEVRRIARTLLRLRPTAAAAASAAGETLREETFRTDGFERTLRALADV